MSRRMCVVGWKVIRWARARLPSIIHTCDDLPRFTYNIYTSGLACEYSACTCLIFYFMLVCVCLGCVGQQGVCARWWWYASAARSKPLSGFDWALFAAHYLCHVARWNHGAASWRMASTSFNARELLHAGHVLVHTHIIWVYTHTYITVHYATNMLCSCVQFNAHPANTQRSTFASKFYEHGTHTWFAALFK